MATETSNGDDAARFAARDRDERRQQARRKEAGLPPKTSVMKTLRSPGQYGDPKSDGGRAARAYDDAMFASGGNGAAQAEANAAQFRTSPSSQLERGRLKYKN